MSTGNQGQQPGAAATAAWNQTQAAFGSAPELTGAANPSVVGAPAPAPGPAAEAQRAPVQQPEWLTRDYGFREPSWLKQGPGVVQPPRGSINDPAVIAQQAPAK